MSDTIKSIGIVGSNHDESLKAMVSYQSVGEATHFILFGNRNDIRHVASDNGISLDKCKIVDTANELESCQLAVKMAAEGKLNVLMKGNVPTALFLGELLDKKYNLMEEGAVLSHVAVLNLPWYHKPLIITDAAVSIMPDIERKAQIIKNALLVARKSGIKVPKVALVSPVDKVNPRIVSTTDAAQLVFLQQSTKTFGDVIIEGPFGLDVALSHFAASVKGIAGEVPGDTDIVLFGNLDAANATYKAFLTMGDVVSAGIIVGAKLPVILTSRSDTRQTRIESIELALKVSL